MRLLVGAVLASITLGAGVSDVKAVYLLPMSGGLDQHLANRLAASQVFHVVTDPKLADAIFTDRLGEAFEQKLTELYAPPVKDKDDNNNGKPAKHVSTLGRSASTVFLVDLKSREVIWSGYEKRNGVSAAGLERVASQIVREIVKQQKAK
jgi:hypothetical protein